MGKRLRTSEPPNHRTRRANHEGKLDKLPSGKLRFRALINGRWVSGSACLTRTQALKSFRERLAKPETRNPKPGTPTLADYARHTLENAYAQQVKSNAMSPTTFALYETIARVHVAPSTLGRRPIDRVTPADIEHWMNNLPVGTNSKLRYLGFVAALFNRAQRTDRIITHNPAADVKKPKPAPSDFTILPIEEQTQLIDAMPDQRLRFAAWLFLHGFGPAEACGVQLSDFRFSPSEPPSNRTTERTLWLHPKRQVQRIDGQLRVRTMLKTNKRTRPVPLDPDFANELAPLLSSSEPPDHRTTGRFLLHTSKGKPLAPDNLRRDFKRALVGTQFENLKPYDNRHTYAMSLLETGVDLQTGSELMRHTIRTFSKYVRSRDALKSDAAIRLSSARRKARHPEQRRKGKAS